MACRYLLLPNSSVYSVSTRQQFNVLTLWSILYIDILYRLRLRGTLDKVIGSVSSLLFKGNYFTILLFQISIILYRYLFPSSFFSDVMLKQIIAFAINPTNHKVIGFTYFPTQDKPEQYLKKRVSVKWNKFYTTFTI